jgi:hypothetical protein
VAQRLAVHHLSPVEQHVGPAGQQRGRQVFGGLGRHEVCVPDQLHAKLLPVKLDPAGRQAQSAEG